MDVKIHALLTWTLDAGRCYGLFPCR